MNEVGLRTGLVGVQAEMTERVAAIESDLRAHDAQHDELVRQLRELKERLAESLETHRLLEEDLEAVKSAAVSGILQWTVEQLGRGAAAIKDAEQTLARREQLRRQREELMRGDPELEGDLRQYRQFEAMPADLLAGLPEYYRLHTLAAHEQLRERLEAYLAFEALERQLPALDAIRVEMIFAQRPDGRAHHAAHCCSAGDQPHTPQQIRSSSSPGDRARRRRMTTWALRLRFSASTRSAR